MDNPIIGVIDSALQLQAAATLAATTISATFDLALGATLVTGQWAPGAGGAAFQVPVPITSYAAPVTLVINATGGTFPITVVNSQGTGTTAALAYNATAATVQAALVGLANVGAGNATVALNGSTYTITLSSGLGICTLTSSGTSLTGGAGTATVTTPTYSFVVNESADGINWRAASRIATVLTDAIGPAGDAYIMLMVQNRFRYLQLVTTVAGTGPSIVLGNVYLQPFANKFGG